MLFNSLIFFYFFLTVFLIYLLLHKHYKWQNKVLLIASYVFYGWWDWRFLTLIFASTVLDYFCGIFIYSAKDQKIKKRFLFASLLGNLGILGFFKYYNFFISSFFSLINSIGVHSEPRLLHIILPVGISFYTFQSISYSVDVYRNQLKPTRRFLDYALFVSFFPQLVAGPIEKAKDLLPRLSKERKLSLGQFQEGCFYIFWGLFEKMYIAGSLAKIVNPVFGDNGIYRGSMVLVSIYAFAFQIFCDFDGYSNIARGLAKCMGIELMLNFNLPYFSTNPKEFWHRWHISLSTWLRDYLYIPLGGSRKGEVFLYLNLFITMFLGGIWHGAAWTFILWGTYQGILLIFHRYYTGRTRRGGEIKKVNRVFKFFKIILFFHFVCLGWLMFRAQSLPQLNKMFISIFFNFDLTGDVVFKFLQLLIIILPLLIAQIGQYFTKDLLFLYKRHWFIKTFAYALMAYLILGYGVMKPEQFIYFQF